MLAGQGPDVFSDWVMPPFVENDMMLDLMLFIKRDNIDLSGFMQGEMSFFQEAARFSPSNPNGLYGLPAYLHTECYAVNLGILDELGLKYPESDWGIEEWTRLWEAATVKPTNGKKQRFGADYDFGGYDGSGNFLEPYWLYGFGGEYVDPTDPTKCYLSSPGSKAMANWIYPLIWEGVLGFPEDWGTSNFAQGLVVCTHNSTCTCGSQVQNATDWRGLKWDYFQDPVWPVRRATFAADDFYGIWSGTKYPELAWEFLKWLTVGPDWQRLVMQTALAGPNQAKLWPEWAEIVRQVAPPLRDKNLEAFVQPVLNQERSRTSAASSGTRTPRCRTSWASTRRCSTPGSSRWTPRSTR